MRITIVKLCVFLFLSIIMFITFINVGVDSIVLFENILQLIIIALPTIISFIVYFHNVHFRWSIKTNQLIIALLSGMIITPFTALIQYGALYIMKENDDYAAINNNNSEKNNNNSNNSSNNNNWEFSTIFMHILFAFFLSFIIAAFFEEICKRFVMDSWTNINMNYYHNEKKYYKNNHQYNLKTTKYGNNNNSTSITSQQDPIQTLLFFHFIGLGFSLFENVLSTFFVNNTDKVGNVHTRSIKLSLHHSLYISTLHCVCCALTASQIFRRDFYGGYELINRGRNFFGYLHILMPSILIHGLFDLVAVLVKLSTIYNHNNNGLEVEQLISIALQTALLVGSIFYVEYILDRLNVYELSYAVRDLDSLSIVSIV